MFMNQQETPPPHPTAPLWAPLCIQEAGSLVPEIFHRGGDVAESYQGNAGVGSMLGRPGRARRPSTASRHRGHRPHYPAILPALAGHPDAIQPRDHGPSLARELHDLFRPFDLKGVSRAAVDGEDLIFGHPGNPLYRVGPDEEHCGRYPETGRKVGDAGIIPDEETRPAQPLDEFYKGFAVQEDDVGTAQEVLPCRGGLEEFVLLTRGYRQLPSRALYKVSGQGREQR
jgi:hypothetical protein